MAAAAGACGGEIVKGVARGRFRVPVVLAAAALFLAVFPLASCNSKKPVMANKVLKAAETWDIDKYSGEKAEADLFWQHASKTNRYLKPLNGAMMGFTGSKQFDDITVLDLEAVSYNVGGITDTNARPGLKAGAVFAVRTSKGNLVKIEVTGFDPAQPGSPDFAKADMNLRYVLYKK